MSAVAPPGTLRVLAWDHPRATRPLAACAAAWERRSGLRVAVATRSLASFGDDVPDAGTADLVLIDHPHVGAAAEAGAIVPLDDLVEAGALAAIETAALGASQRSYRHRGRTWALAVDAACQALAARPGEAPPSTWDGVLARVDEAPGSVALPLHPAHAISALLSLLAGRGSPPGGDALAPAADLEAAVDALARVAGSGPHEALAWEPPDALAALEAGAIRLVPLAYAYCGYAVAWHDAPAARPGGAPASILGGVGAAVLAGAVDVAAAAAFAAFLADPATQRDIVAPAGGQPAARAGWAAADPALAGLVATFAHARARPTAAWWPDFQREGGERLHDGLAQREEPARIARALAETYRRHRRSAP